MRQASSITSIQPLWLKCQRDSMDEQLPQYNESIVPNFGDNGDYYLTSVEDMMGLDIKTTDLIDGGDDEDAGTSVVITDCDCDCDDLQSQIDDLQGDVDELNDIIDIVKDPDEASTFSGPRVSLLTFTYDRRNLPCSPLSVDDFSTSIKLEAFNEYISNQHYFSIKYTVLTDTGPGLTTLQIDTRLLQNGSVVSAYNNSTSRQIAIPSNSPGDVFEVQIRTKNRDVNCTVKEARVDDVAMIRLTIANSLVFATPPSASDATWSVVNSNYSGNLNNY